MEQYGNFTKVDYYYMKRALSLAKKGIGYVNPNPPVGAVIVKEGKIIGSGYHRAYGQHHAERVAIINAKNNGADLRGATMYVTLEPCDHYGKTPPCTDAIIEAGISKVVVATRDPNPASGDGTTKLRNAGIDVQIGLMEEEAKNIMRFFIKSVTNRIPYVTIKYAATLDGKIADLEGNSKWITNTMRKIVHKLRHEHMAILVGANTILKDNPYLNTRLSENIKYLNPIKIILDREGRILKLEDPTNLNIFKTTDNHCFGKVILFTSHKDDSRVKSLEEKVMVIHSEEITPKFILKTLHNLRINSLLVEGGSEIFSQFLGFADEIYAFYALKVLGKGLDVFSCINNSLEDSGKQFKDFEISKLTVSQDKKEFMVVIKRCSLEL
ncbi:MAG: bifunctional diaminohydroxyphosphoribosylaminopyrimidine deaminase/5-amino-6-(5-phosphoribosylamino)uracil reductase RibD [Fervidobacterium sp.]|uniref:bifunctional diaminohydroxyphosphoribosylaminopyrimidine deaminase/5-amino-6-(5-phosphoribosylamino)uracil reductase RibD n=1 Tax=Fervidobacterium sp. TaxID=1871331 RepID=UPI00404B7136